MHLTVTSSARNAEKFSGRCVESVKRQTHKAFQHVFIDADSTDNTFVNARIAADRGYDDRFDITKSPSTKTALDNLLPIWLALPPEEVVVWVDGDDQLLVDHALEIVSDYHEQGAWVTYGQFVTEYGVPGFSGQVGHSPRTEPWRASHLKTFRAGLIQKIPPEYLLQKNGAWDQSVMLACLELAGPYRSKFIPNCLYLYNFGHSAEVNWSAEQKKLEHEEVRRIRSMRPLSKLESLR